ncbi:MAG TPA: cupredoxin domain-containing protein [Baekduia sp.]
MTTRIVRPIHGAAVAGLAVLALAPIAAARTVAHASASTTVHVTEKEFSIKLSPASLGKPGTVRFAVKNAGQTGHTFKINGKATRVIQPGKSASLVVAFKKKGSYHYLCTVDDHAAMGMKGVFTVR